MVIKAHRLADIKSENSGIDTFIGTTQKGIGPSYSSKSLRDGLRFGDLFDWTGFKSKYYKLVSRYEKEKGITYDYKKELSVIKGYRKTMLKHGWITDTIYMLNKALQTAGNRVLVEGANGIMLDQDYGTYPYVTSSSTGVAGIFTGLGLPPRHLETTIGVVKAYTTRVGEGPFPTELTDKIGAAIQEIGSEIGATSGRPRRCGWLDIQQLKYSNIVNDYNSINLTKLDILGFLDEIKVGVGYTLDGKKYHGFP